MSAHAVDFYDVEILVFRQFDSQGDDEELDVPNESYGFISETSGTVTVTVNDLNRHLTLSW